MTTIANCDLTIDEARGVIWVNSMNGRCLLRICSLPAPIPEGAVAQGLDITYGQWVSWDPARAEV